MVLSVTRFIDQLPRQGFGPFRVTLLDGIQQFDMKIDKPFVFGNRVRVMVSMDIFNMFNRGPVAVQNDNFATTTTTWQQPQAILSGRLIKLSGQFDF